MPRVSLLLLPWSNVVRIAVETSPSAPRAKLFDSESEGGIWLRPVCGARTSQLQADSFSSAVPKGSTFCLRSSCLHRLKSCSEVCLSCAFRSLRLLVLPKSSLDPVESVSRAVVRGPVSPDPIEKRSLRRLWRLLHRTPPPSWNLPPFPRARLLRLRLLALIKLQGSVLTWRRAGLSCGYDSSCRHWELHGPVRLPLHPRFQEVFGPPPPPSCCSRFLLSRRRPLP